SATALAVRTSRAANPIALGALAVAGASVVWTPFAARKVAEEDNLRRVLLERAPVLGRSVVLAARIAPPPPLEEDDAATTTLTSLRVRRSRALDWAGRDIVL